MKKKRKGYLHGEDLAIGGMDDAFYMGELYLEKMGGFVGKKIGLNPKQSLKKNKLLKTLHELESKAHATHSPLQRNYRFTHSFQKPILDTKLSKLRKVIKRFPKKD